MNNFYVDSRTPEERANEPKSTVTSSTLNKDTLKERVEKVVEEFIEHFGMSWELPSLTDSNGILRAEWEITNEMRRRKNVAIYTREQSRNFLLKKISTLIEQTKKEERQKIDKEWMSLNLRQDNQENWNKELSKFGVFMQNNIKSNDK